LADEKTDEGKGMSFLRTICFPSALLCILLPWQQASAAVIFATDFNNVATGSTYPDSTVLNTGTMAQVTLRTATNANFAIVDRGSGDHALQFLDNDSSGSTGLPKANSLAFTPLSTTSTGNNTLIGSFTYTRLLTNTSSTTSPSFVFTATNSGTGGGFDLQLSVENNGHLNYYNGATNVDSGFTLLTGTEYTFQITADLSSATQDTWSLSLVPVGSQTAVVQLANLNTKVANGNISQFSFWGGLNQPAVNASAFGQLDNISFSAQPVPEPASMSLALVAGGLLLRRKC